VRWLIAIAVVGILCGLPSRAAAQVLASVDASVSSATYDQFAPSAVYTVAPSVAFAGGPLRLGLDGAFSEFETGHLSGLITLGSAVGAKIYGPLRWELAGEGSALWYRSNPAVVTGLVTPRLRVDQGSFSAWAGGGVGGTNIRLPGSFVSRVDEGMSYALPHVTSTFTIASNRVGIYHYTDVGGAIQSELGRFGLNAAGGTRSGALLGGVATWGVAEARATVVSGVAIILAAGSYPADLVRGAPGYHFIGIGVRLSDAFRVRRPSLTTGRYSALNGASDVMPDARTLRFTAPANAHVEIMADFTSWQPMPMIEVQPGLFQVTLADALRSGPHRVNIRVDNGDWSVPRELPPVVDDFGGKAGALVVP
jgi:hypothetical protein